MPQAAQVSGPRIAAAGSSAVPNTRMAIRATHATRAGWRNGADSDRSAKDHTVAAAEMPKMFVATNPVTDADPQAAHDTPHPRSTRSAEATTKPTRRSADARAPTSPPATSAAKPGAYGRSGSSHPARRMRPAVIVANTVTQNARPGRPAVSATAAAASQPA